MFGAWTGSQLPGDQVLLRTKHDLQAHEERYDYLTEMVSEDVDPGESLDVTTEVSVGDVGRYWGCFKVLREDEKEFYCAFRYFMNSCLGN